MANYNPASVNELEEKKWLISRIDQIHQLLIKELESENKRYANLGQKIISESKTRRNYYLSALGVALSVLVGVNPIYNIDVVVFSFFLIGIFVTGLIIFAMYNWAISKVENVFNFLDTKIIMSIGNLAESQGFLTTRMSIISMITMQQAYNYLTFSILLNYASMIDFVNAIKKHAKQYKKYPAFKRDLNSIAKNYEVDLKLLPTYYERFDKTDNLPKNLVDFIEKNLKPIIDDMKTKQ